MLNRPLPAPARDIAILIARIILGVVLFAHGWQKLMINGISGTYGQFEKLGIPLAIVSASFASFVEFVGGVLIVLGALTTTVVALDLVVMVGAAGFVHATHGIFAEIRDEEVRRRSDVLSLGETIAFVEHASRSAIANPMFCSSRPAPGAMTAR